MAQQGSLWDRIKRPALAVAGVLFVVVFVYQLFLSSPTPRPKRGPQAGVTNGGTSPQSPPTTAVSPQKHPLGAAAQQEALMQELLSDMTPLNLKLVSSGDGRSSEPGSRGNIFAYYVPPPEKPKPPPPPPPIQLLAIQPQGLVAGTPRPVTVVVTGNKIPADAQIILDGGPRVTKRMSDAQLSTEISATDYASAHNMSVEVKSQSNPADNSNQLAIVIQPAPEPQFIFKGRLGALGQPQYNYAVFELSSTKEIKRAKVGDTVMGVWRVDAIAADSVDVTHTQYDIKRRIPLQEKLR